ncbi:MAG: hypothetical protein OXI22_18180 [Defluviicoccus sp.]|nr:hypothetical protein [Defluviicoccus sp.]
MRDRQIRVIRHYHCRFSVVLVSSKPMADKVKSGNAATAKRPVAWQIKGIKPETRAAVREAARRAGVSIGAWTNEVLHREAVAALTGDRNLPVPVIEDQLAELTRRVDRLSRPFWRRLFDRGG